MTLASGLDEAFALFESAEADYERLRDDFGPSALVTQVAHRRMINARVALDDLRSPPVWIAKIVLSGELIYIERFEGADAREFAWRGLQYTLALLEADPREVFIQVSKKP